MVACELCGKVAENLIKVKIAGTLMSVCNNCRSMGHEIEIKKDRVHMFRYKQKEEKVQEVISDYQQKINLALNKKNLNLHQLAKAVNIKESTLNKYLTGKLKPDLITAKKLENFLETTLLIEDEEEKEFSISMIEEQEEQISTLGDLLKKQMENKK